MGKQPRRKQARKSDSTEVVPQEPTAPGERTDALVHSPSSPWNSRWLGAASLLLLMALTVIAFSNAAPSALVYDDKFFVPRRSLTLDNAAAMFGESALKESGRPSRAYRPLTTISFALENRLGASARTQHWTNLGLHLAATLAVYGLLRLLLAREKIAPPLSILCALVASLVFGLHPLHTDAIDSVFNRSEMLACLFVVAALGVLLLCRLGKWKPWVIAAALYLIALLCKESAVTLPLLALLVLRPQAPQDSWQKRLQVLAPGLLLFVSVGIYAFLRSQALSKVGGALQPEHLGLGERLELTFAAIGELLRRLVWPHPLRASYANYVAQHVAAWVMLHGIVLATAISLRKRAWLVCSGVLFFYLALLPSTRLFADSTVSAVGERYAYLPSVGIVMALCWGLVWIAKRFGKIALAVTGVPLTAILLVLTLQRNRAWQSEIALFQAEIKATPENPDAWAFLTDAYHEAGQNEQAAAVCVQGLALHSRDNGLQNNCGLVSRALGRHLEAAERFRQAVEFGFGVRARMNLAREYATLGRKREAEEEFRRAAKETPSKSLRHVRLGEGLYRVDRLEEAKAELEAALAADPSDPAARSWLEKVQRGLQNKR